MQQERQDQELKADREGTGRGDSRAVPSQSNRRSFRFVKQARVPAMCRQKKTMPMFSLPSFVSVSFLRSLCDLRPVRSRISTRPCFPLLHTNKYEKVPPSFGARAAMNNKKRTQQKRTEVSRQTLSERLLPSQRSRKVQWLVVSVGQRNVLPTFLFVP